MQFPDQDDNRLSETVGDFRLDKTDYRAYVQELNAEEALKVLTCEPLRLPVRSSSLQDFLQLSHLDVHFLHAAIELFIAHSRGLAQRHR